jgi:hypothetical protein
LEGASNNRTTDSCRRKGEDDDEEETKYSKTLLIRTNYGLTLVQISGSPNYRNITENMLKEVIKWTSLVFLGNTALF